MPAKVSPPEDSPAASPGRVKLVLVTGLSGSGKSTATKALEDIGYHCIDNLPLPLLRTFLADPLAHVGSRDRIALVADVRAEGFAETVTELLERVDREQFDFVVLFLETSESALVRRYSETRRSHPLAAGDRPLIQGIRRERQLLAELRGRADLIFDTTDWTVHDVRREIYREFTEQADEDVRMVVSLVSFGFKHGLPKGSDMLFDVRYLPNPYFIPGLRQQTGQDEDVRRFLHGKPEYLDLLQRLDDFILYLLPQYQRENRSYLSISIGCTGGRHRSVAICEDLAERLGRHGWTVRLNHRDHDR